MNKRKVVAVLLASSIISSCIISGNVVISNADTINSKKVSNTVNNEINKGVVLNSTFLRDEKGNVLGKSTSYDMLDIIKSYNDKYLVITQSGIKGYLNSSDFEIVNSGENLKFESLDKVSKVKNVTTVLNLREQPTINSNIIDTIPNNTILHIKGKQGDWYKVNVNNKIGFVYGLFTDAKEAKDQKVGNTNVEQAKKNSVGIKVQESKKQAYRGTFRRIRDEAKAENKAKKSTIASPNTATTKVSDSKTTVKINKSDVEMYTSNKVGIVRINNGYLYLRSGASINDKEIGTLDEGSKLTILGHDGNWYLVRTANGQEGFVFGQYIKFNDNVTKHSAPIHEVVKSTTDKKHDSVVKPTVDKGHDTVVTPSKTETKPVEKPQVTKPINPAVINNAPVVKANNIFLVQGEKFTDDMLKATASDKEDGNLTGSIVYTGHVNTEVPGIYTIYLSVKDSQGAIAKTSAIVTVKAKVAKPSEKPAQPTKPEVVKPVDKTQQTKPVEKPVQPTKPAEKPQDSKPAEKPQPVFKPADLNNAPTIEGHDLTMTEGQKFSVDMLGLNAQDKEDGNLTANIKVLQNNVNINKVGKYEVVVKVTDKQGASCKREFIVTVKAKPVIPSVINACPEITGHGVEIEQGTKFSVNMLALKATDKEDGDLTDSIKVIGEVNTAKVGTYKVTATVSDKNGAKASKTFTVKVIEEEAPVLNGKNITITEGDKFDTEMLGLTASDKEDGNLTEYIKIVSNNVDVDKAGTYEVVASVSDSFGKTTTKTFKVIVKAKSVVGWTADSKEFHNAVAQKMYSLVNAHRQAHGVKPLGVNQALVNAANWKSRDMTDRNYFDHEDAQGKYTHDIAEFQDATSENIAQRTFDKTTNLTKADADALATALFDQWKKSSGHNAAMLDDTSSEMGFGFVLTDKGLVNATQEFNFCLG